MSVRRALVYPMRARVFSVTPGNPRTPVSEDRRRGWRGGRRVWLGHDRAAIRFQVRLVDPAGHRTAVPALELPDRPVAVAAWLTPVDLRERQQVELVEAGLEP